MAPAAAFLTPRGLKVYRSAKTLALAAAASVAAGLAAGLGGMIVGFMGGIMARIVAACLVYVTVGQELDPLPDTDPVRDIITRAVSAGCCVCAAALVFWSALKEGLEHNAYECDVEQGPFTGPGGGAGVNAARANRVEPGN